jgi:hypothetical protein
MNTKKALGGLLGLFGSLLAFFDCFVPAPAPLRFNLTNKIENKSKQKIEHIIKKFRSNRLKHDTESNSREKKFTGYQQVWHRKQFSSW